MRPSAWLLLTQANIMSELGTQLERSTTVRSVLKIPYTLAHDTYHALVPYNAHMTCSPIQ